MIVIGYPGVGKSTISKRNIRYVDFDSSIFPKEDGWEEDYVNKAISLSKEGHVVFISAHEKVRDLVKDCREKIVVVYPSLKLHDFWIQRLKDRYNKSRNAAEYRALYRCVSNYGEDILKLKESKFKNKIELKEESYDLEKLLEKFE